MRKIVFTLLFILILSSNYAETILLKDGEVIQGKIRNQNINSIKVEVNGNGELREILKEKIYKIIYRDPNQSVEDKSKSEEPILPSNQLEEDKKKRQDESSDAKDKAPLLKEEEPKPITIEADPPEEKQNVNLEPSKGEEPKRSIPSRLAVTGCSIILPGCGQFMERRYMAGILYPLLLIAGGAAYSSEKQKHANAVNNFNSLSNPILLGGFLLNFSNPPPPIENTFLIYYAQKSSVENSHVSSARNIGIGIALIYLFNIFDAYYFYNENAFTDNRTRGFFLDYQLVSQSGITSVSHISKYDPYYIAGYSFRF